ncbi:Tetratricopeptide repeat protein [Ooceraea biroi]|uniref:Tetratricopeptide repeat protein n=1 Tax=Ooceraea biroi TaxID=2015173 RepID=A0A026W4B4_OOCBI|nr:Tetratricopeptide repeat protein [Ooceraea biroi]
MEQSSVQDARIKRSIKIVIETIENITTKKETAISFIVIHNDVLLGECPLIIEAGYKEPPQIYNVNFTVELPFIVNNRSNMNLIVSTPILIKVMCSTQDQQSLNSITSSAESKKKVTTITHEQIGSNVIGFCNLDLMPLLLGEKLLTEKLIVQTRYLSFDGTAVSWQNLPVLTVTIMCDDEIFSSDAIINFLSITVESIYNPPECFAKDAEYKVATIVYADEATENLIFEDGKWTKYRDVERTKRWQSLPKLQSRARLSKRKLSQDYANIKNTVNAEFDLQKKMWLDEPRIEWNCMSRSMMSNAEIQAMQKHITKYKYWPFQFIVPETRMGRDNTKSKKEMPIKYQIYQCYVDLSELLFPGKKDTRVMAQLYTHNASNMAEKTGLKEDIFHIELWNKDSKEQGRKTKASESIQSDSEVAQSTPLVTETGEPVIVLIEVELHYPFIPCRLETDFSSIIDDMMRPKVTKPFYIYSGDVAEDQYATCIQKLVEIITESYRDELTCFTQYLYKTGTYLAIRSTLKMKVITLLDQNFKINMNTIHSVNSQNFIASVYMYLVERMHLAINKIIESRLVDDNSSKMTESEKLYFYAEEAYELGHTDDARRHQTTIAADKSNSEAWTNLLIYGLILVENRNCWEAETFLRAITDFYPRFVEGWVILHLFYIHTDYSPGVDLTLRLAEECMRDEYRETEFSSENSLVWSTVHCPRDNIYMITFMLLMKLHSYDFAGMALAEEIFRTGRSIHVLYYLAVLHYLSHRYEDALSHLKEAECNYGLLQRYTEAEAALLEANHIDNHNANVWKYLCFLNMSLQRHDEFAQCYRQMIQCAIFILGLLQITMFTTIKCNASSDFMPHRARKRDNVPRVRIKVFRGPTEEGNGELFTTWGYWIQQPSR